MAGFFRLITGDGLTFIDLTKVAVIRTCKSYAMEGHTDFSLWGVGGYIYGDCTPHAIVNALTATWEAQIERNTD